MRAIWNITSSKTPAEPVFEGGGHVRALTVRRSPQARTMRLVVDPRGGEVRLTLPRRASLAEAFKWAETKRGWVSAQLACLPKGQPVEPGMRFLFAGRDVTLDWTERYPRTPMLNGETLRAGGPRDQLSARLLRWLRAEARRLLEAETREIAALAGRPVARVGVGDPVSRWGSCSPSGDVRYSWRLILAPTDVRRATVAHEVAHLVHMNHGREFHRLAAELHGSNPMPARRWLREHGATLHWFGRER